MKIRLRPHFRGSLLIAFTAAGIAIGATVAAPVLGAQESLDALVAAGLRDNLTRRQEQLASGRAAAQVTEARGRFLPSATINARYTESSGNIVDLGSLINPAFKALNQLTQSQSFPTDLSLRLPQKQETTIRFAQPLFQPAIAAAYHISTNLRDAQDAQRDAVTRQIALEIRSAYLTVVKARRVVDIYGAAVPLVDENLRLAEKLVGAGKATPDVIFRARADRSDVLQKKSDADRQAVSAAEYLNLLLERPLDTPFPVFSDDALGIDSLPALDAAITRANAGREELRQLNAARGATSAQKKLAESAYLPAISLAVDYGVQGSKYRFARDADFTNTSLVLSWNVFNGSQDAARAEQAAFDTKRVDAQAALAARQIELQVRTSWASANVAREAISTANDRVEAARRTFDLTRRRYEQGLAPQIELIDARTALTNAELNRVLTTFDYYLRRVELDRAAALYPRSIN
jgi:outer membrane protein TolC